MSVGSPRRLLSQSEAFSLPKAFTSRDLNEYSSGQKCFSCTHPPLPAAWKLVGWVFLAGHSAEGIILDSANKKEGEMDTGWEAGVVRH